jgi:hypothetical protein
MRLIGTTRTLAAPEDTDIRHGLLELARTSVVLFLNKAYGVVGSDQKKKKGFSALCITVKRLEVMVNIHNNLVIGVVKACFSSLTH